ncbi:hypothetical protein [Azohydromonas caseinilytica]|uniref:Uncharacterized protein n=1 Tax=Azohydromonas caseinilytica TaxID=2728836 RepID=A0A848FF86_9BURK|nr:hypothetical protein [Azohydromonas caseinilytica]NML16923.1 hypothetical protein [Azohydromonas caseinilytica]
MALLLSGIMLLCSSLYWAAFISKLPAFQATLPYHWFAAIVVAAIIISFTLAPKLMWLWATGTALFTISAFAILPDAWTGSLGKAVSSIPLTVGAVFLAPALAIPAGIIHSATLLTYLLATKKRKTWLSSFKLLSRVTWEECEYKEMGSFSMGAVATIAVIALLTYLLSPVISYLFTSLRPWFEAASSKFGIPPVGIGICIGLSLYASLPFFVDRMRKASQQKFVNRVPRALGTAFLVFTATMPAALTGAWVFARLDQWLGSMGAQIVITLAIIAGLIVLSKQCWNVAKKLAIALAIARQPYRPCQFTPAQWQAMVKNATPHGKESILQRTNHQALGLEPRQFLDLLRDMRKSFETDPALGTYWRMRHELEQILRQEQQGGVGSP